MDGKVLGKIKEIDIVEEYGHIYLQVELGSDNHPEGNWGVANSYPIVVGPGAAFPTEWKIFPLADYMKAAGAYHLQDMRNKPIEAIFDRNILQSWRILTESI